MGALLLENDRDEHGNADDGGWRVEAVYQRVHVAKADGGSWTLTQQSARLLAAALNAAAKESARWKW